MGGPIGYVFHSIIGFWGWQIEWFHYHLHHLGNFSATFCLILGAYCHQRVNHITYWLSPPALTVVPEGLCFIRIVFLIFIYLFCCMISELPWLIVVKLCHVIGIWVCFIMQV